MSTAMAQNLIASHLGLKSIEMDDSYENWLRSRLKNTIAKLDSGELKSYPLAEAKQLLASRLAARRKASAGFL